jgi:hypothetical protein
MTMAPNPREQAPANFMEILLFPVAFRDFPEETAKRAEEIIFSSFWVGTDLFACLLSARDGFITDKGTGDL